MKKLSIIVIIFALLSVAIAPTFAQDEEGGNTIADIVVASAGGEEPEFTTLLDAVSAADPAVLEALSDPEAEFTVFAPTDAAFAAVEGLDEIVADTELLTQILLFHVVEGSVMSADVVAALEANDGAFQANTLQGQYLDVATTEEGGVTVNGAGLILEMVDIEADNGVIHVIDAVMVPEQRTIAEIATELSEAEEPQFVTLMQAVGAADGAVAAALSDPEAELTVFAPTDDAFAAVEGLADIVADTELLTSILLYHVVEGRVGSDAVMELLGEEMEPVEVETLNGATVRISAGEDGSVMVNDATVIITNVDAANGVIHVIDAVITPGE